jgi:ankyrin repeat protein
VAEPLLANKADVNATDRDRWTPLHFAANMGDEGMTAFLLANHADVNIMSIGGYTPLHFAAFARHKEVAGLLRQHGGQY